jgi:uncharacterized protein (TIGR03437 family)
MQENDMYAKRCFYAVPVLISLAITAGAQTITTAAGSTTWGGPADVALDGAGNMYVADYAGHAVYKIDRLASVTTIAGTPGKSGFSGDGALATSALLSGPLSVAVDADGTIYIADYLNNRIRRISNGIITTFAGDGRATFAGDNGPAASASIRQPLDLVIDAGGNLLIADYGNARIRSVAKNGVITTIAGTGRFASSGDNGPPLAADIVPAALALGADGSIYFADNSLRSSPTAPKVRKISANRSTVTTVAGSGARGSAGDGASALAATFPSIDGIAVDSGGNLYISEFDGDRIRRVGANGIITNYAGTGIGGLSGDGADAVKAQMSEPLGLVLEPAGSLLVADYANRRIRRISAAALPALSSTNFALPSFLGKAGFSSNTYLELYGTSLAQSTRTWAGTDFNGPNAPTSLDGVSVTVNGKPAFIFYISPTQININTPDDTATGPVQIQVRNALGATIATVNRSRISPSLQTVSQFLIGGKQYVVALTPDFQSFIGRPNMLAGVSFVAARPGSTISIYALGCGPTNPATQAGVVAGVASPLALPYDLRIGGVSANVTFAGIVGGSIGLYQFNVVIPNVPAGDQPIELTVDGVSTGQNLTIVIGQ